MTCGTTGQQVLVEGLMTREVVQRRDGNPVVVLLVVLLLVIQTEERGMERGRAVCMTNKKGGMKEWRGL